MSSSRTLSAAAAAPFVFLVVALAASSTGHPFLVKEGLQEMFEELQEIGETLQVIGETLQVFEEVSGLSESGNSPLSLDSIPIVGDLLSGSNNAGSSSGSSSNGGALSLDNIPIVGNLLNQNTRTGGTASNSNSNGNGNLLSNIPIIGGLFPRGSGRIGQSLERSPEAAIAAVIKSHLDHLTQEQITGLMRMHLETLKLLDGRSGQWAHGRLASLGPSLLPGDLNSNDLSGTQFNRKLYYG